MKKLAFIQRSPSQLDMPFYMKLSNLSKGKAKVFIMNEYGLKREKLDPEMGVTPKFPEYSGDYLEWVDCQSVAIYSFCRRLVDEGFSHVVIQDQPWSDRIRFALILRFFGISVGLRTDKNFLSETARLGVLKKFECFFVRGLFDFFAPVSHLTSSYYGFDAKDCVYFPYCTNDEKYLVSQARRSSAKDEIRGRLTIPSSSKVILAVSKLHDRENPKYLIDIFRMASVGRDVFLIFVGDGPLRLSLENYVEKEKIINVAFVGYVQYSDLENYFFASDIFVHVPKFGPWEVSVPDALIQGMGVLASWQVGSAHACFDDSTSKFIVSSDSSEEASRLLAELIDLPTFDVFNKAKETVEKNFSVTVVADSWYRWLLV